MAVARLQDTPLSLGTDACTGTLGEYKRASENAVLRRHFILYVVGEANCRLAGGNGERATLNYNPLRDTAEFAFKIKRA